MGEIYCATNTVNGKRYIGKTSRSMSDRREGHEYAAIHGSHYVFHRALMKYGFGVFMWEVLHSDLDDDELNLYEIGIIRNHGTMIPNGYNMTPGGDGCPCDEAGREMRRRLVAGKTYEEIYGVEGARAKKAKSSKTQKGRQIPESSRRKMSEVRLERFASMTDEERRGTTAHLQDYWKFRGTSGARGARWSHTPEAREKIRSAKTGTKASAEARRKMSESAKRRYQRQKENQTAVALAPEKGTS